MTGQEAVAKDFKAIAFSQAETMNGQAAQIRELIRDVQKAQGEAESARILAGKYAAKAGEPADEQSIREAAEWDTYWRTRLERENHAHDMFHQEIIFNVMINFLQDRVQKGLTGDGIVDFLAGAADCPQFHELLRAGQHGLSQMSNTDRHHRGVRPGGGVGNAARFVAYWSHWRGANENEQDTMVERLAAETVRRALCAEDRYVLTAVAACMGNLEEAAAVADLSFNVFKGRVRAARRNFLVLWHEMETPRLPARSTPVLRQETRRPPCGTRGGYEAHRYRKEQACDPCLAASSSYSAGRRAARKVSAA